MAFTKAQLSAAFDKVADPADWKNPIHAVVTVHDVKITVEAIQYFTAAPVEVERLNSVQSLITSPGYRLGPAGA